MKLHQERPGYDPVGQLPPLDWLIWPETQKIIAILTEGGVDARFVGGCVRDAIAKRPVADVDLATPETPDEVIAKLNRHQIRVIPTGIDHGTVTAHLDGRNFEITTLRADIATDGRHAEVAFSKDWYQDAKRRDFTINALSADAQGRVFDPFDGLADLGAGKVRFIGLAEQRILEDHLRILRFFRFHARYGRGHADMDAMAACRKHAAKVCDLSGERIWQELEKIFASPDPATVLLSMNNAGVLELILPGFAMDRIGAVRVLSWLEDKGLARQEVRPDPLRHLAELAPDGEKAELWASRLKLSNAAAFRLIALQERLNPEQGELALRQRLYDLGSELGLDCALLAWAEERAKESRPNAARTSQWQALLDQIRDWHQPEFPLKGRDLDFVPKGPAMGRVLTRTKAWWRDQDFRPDYAACLEKARLLSAAP